VSATTVRAWLRIEGLGPAGQRGEMTWRDFVQAHRQSLLAVDLHGRDDLAGTTLRSLLHRVGQPSCAPGRVRLYVMFFIEAGSVASLCRVHGPPRRRMGHATGAGGGVDVRRTGGSGSCSHPRSRSQIHGRLRCRSRGRTHPNRSDADSRTRGEWDRRAGRPHRSVRMPGLALDPERTASGARAHLVY
jgi:hypothetical protein